MKSPSYPYAEDSRKTRPASIYSSLMSFTRAALMLISLSVSASVKATNRWLFSRAVLTSEATSATDSLTSTGESAWDRFDDALN